MAKTSPAQFIRQVRQEVTKVTWPSRRETMLSTVTVFGMVVVIALFFFVIDQILGELVQLVLGLGG